MFSGNIFDDGRSKFNHVARLSASSEETVLMRAHENLTKLLDSQEVQTKLF